MNTWSYLSSGLPVRLSCRPDALSEEPGVSEQGMEADLILHGAVGNRNIKQLRVRKASSSRAASTVGRKLGVPPFSIGSAEIRCV